MAKRKRKRPHRNFTKTQFEELRRKLDSGYNELHDSLEEAYYDYWKSGESRPWQGYDVQPTPEESKVLFDRLHGLIWLHYSEELHSENKKLPEGRRYDERKYDIILDRTGAIVGRRSTAARAEINRLETAHKLTLQKPKRIR